MDHIVFGAAYYAEYMPCERVAEDMRLMCSCGINTIRIAESTWANLEPHDGVFDFSYVDHVIKAAADAGIDVIVGTPTYAIPSWLARLDASVMVTRATGPVGYGPRQSMNLLSPVFLEHADRVCEALVAHTAPYANVIGFQIDNETKHYGNTGPEMQQAFTAHLQKTYGSCEELNRAFGLNYWSNAIFSWDDVPDITNCINGSLRVAFEAFRCKVAADFLARQADIVRSARREGQFITHNMDFSWERGLECVRLSDKTYELVRSGLHELPHSYGLQKEISHFETARSLTLCGLDVYHPTQDKLTGAEIAYAGDEIRSLQQHPYLVLETQSQGFASWTPYPGQLRLQAYSHLASGALGVMYWNWMSIHNGPEAYWKGILSHDFSCGRTYREIAKIGSELARLGPDALIAEKKNRVAVMVDTVSLHALDEYPPSPASELRYNDILRWVYDALFEMNIECDVLDARACERRVLDPAVYALVVTPALYCTGEALTQALKAYVASGGVLVGTLRSFVANEHASISTVTLPAGMNECFGVHYDQITSPGGAMVGKKPAYCLMELLEADSAETLYSYEHPVWGDFSAASRNRYGKGYAYYVGTLCDATVLKAVYQRACKDAGLECLGYSEGLRHTEHAQHTEQTFTWPLIVRSGYNRGGVPLHYVLNYSAKPVSFACPYEKVRDMLSGSVYAKGELICVESWGVAILRESV